MVDLGNILWSAGIGALANLTGATESSGSEVPVAGPWGSPDEKAVWDEAMEGIFGRPATDDDPGQPTLFDQIQANQQFRKETGAGYLDNIGTANQEYLTGVGDLGSYLKPQFLGSIGDVSAVGVPKFNRDAYTAGERHYANLRDPQLSYATEVRDTNLSNQPYQFDYLDRMLGLAVPFNANRRGLQATYSPSLFNDFSTVLASLSGTTKKNGGS